MQSRQRARGAALVACLLAAACGGRRAARSPALVVALDTPVETFTLDEARAIAQAVGTQALFDRVAQPSPWLTDFFGVQALQRGSLKNVVADMVPKYATLEHMETFAVTLALRDGTRVTFHDGTKLMLNGNPVPGAYARIELQDPAAYPAQPVAFRALLERAGLARYLVPNPYFDIERIVDGRMHHPQASDVVAFRNDTLGLAASPHAVVLIGETHGGTGPGELARRLLASPVIDWIAIEMLPEDLQPALNAYLRAHPGSDAYTRSRGTLLHFYQTNWNTRGDEVTADPADNPYFKLIEQARSLGKGVYALDTESRFILFRFGEFPLGATTRDYVWARNMPPRGRGVIYGGSSHFDQNRRPNMLSFLREHDPRIAIFSLRADD